MAITEKQITRINELARKSKAEGLTEEEREEQAVLRQAYIASIKYNIRSQLDNIDIVEKEAAKYHER